MAGVDKRELILLRLKAILDGVPGIVAAWRDRGEVPPTDKETGDVQLPALVLLDGTEDILVSTKGKNVYGKNIPNTLGEQLSAFRISVYKAITTDPGLLGLLGTSGGIEYRGSVTDMQSGGSLEGQMRLDFWLDYVFNPAEL